jgi:peptidoglycan/xylan/chitin deacetylase (PgdA/CDA1 family)/CelD/BcsL family acetyltransferase involved in cellulose biosynthesis
MKIIEIREEAQLQRLKSDWETLLKASASDTIFLTWEWIVAWWSVYGKTGELRILAAFDDSHVLRGIAPLRCQILRRYGQAVAALTFVGDGSNDSDYLDFIIARGYEEQVMSSFQAYWTSDLRQVTLLALNELPETSPNFSLLRDLAQRQKMIWAESNVPCGTVHLPENWEKYLSVLRPRFRTKVRSVLRNLESRSEVRFGFCEDRKRVQQMLPILFELHTRRWAQDNKPGVFGWDQKREFYLTLSELLLERGWLRFSWLEWNGLVVACQYGFAYQGTYFQLQEGYDPACEHWNVGIGLRAWSTRQFLKEGLREYDFMGGMGRHKSDWGAETKISKRIALSRATLMNLMVCRGPQWQEHVAESVKKLIPKKLLAARRVRLEARSSSAFRQSQRGQSHTRKSREWMRKVASHCYYHFQLPRFARSIRSRYQIAVAPNGKWPKFSWGRRMETAGRILYFHRVNNENDPFFPAMRTELFEQEMRFVAEHYEVVSLAELLDHLEEGRPETLISITFDDGYADNYQNAFPVLQRYGLPATIFLTTGSVDSREPLWFEQLALALKRTNREFIDLELDIPRRFKTRTQGERLQANDQIFQLMKVLPDARRREWLSQILQQLEVLNDGERNNKMLTWDQIRFMSANGIEFGGHTVTHPFLSRTTQEQATWEVSECKRRIETELQKPADYFAYPNGREEDFCDWNKEAIHRAGYRAALSTLWGVNYRFTDRMALRRGGPWEESPELFASKLDWYQLVNA